MLTRLKNWLHHSGIKYALAYDVYDLANVSPLQGTEMMDSLNPFEPVIEHPEYPLARIYRKSVWTGFTDTFEVLMGDHYDIALKGNGRKGILDLLVFPLVGRWFMGYAYNTGNMGLRIVTGAIGYALEIPRGLLGIALTMALSPLVMLTHAFTYQKSRAYNKAIQQLEVTKVTTDELTREFNPTNNREVAEEKAEVIQKTKMPFSIMRGYGMIIPKISRRPIPLHDKVERFVINIYQGPTYRLDLKEKNIDGIKALLATNTCNILEKFKENPRALKHIQRWTEEPLNKEIRKTILLCARAPRAGEAPSAIHGFFKASHFTPDLAMICFNYAGIATDKQSARVHHC